MRKGNLTREQATETAGLAAVLELDKESAEFTNRVQCDGDDSVEFSSSVGFFGADGDQMSLTAYYYQNKEDLDRVEGLDSLEWEIEGYEIY